MLPEAAQKLIFRGLPGLLFLCLIAFDANAQDPFYIPYNEQQGLPSSEVYGLGEDENGLIWFATDRGLASYNGYEFRMITSPEIPGGKSFLDIAEAKDQTLWLTALDGSVYSLKSGQISAADWNGLESERVMDYFVSNLIVDQEGNACFRENTFSTTYFQYQRDEDTIYTRSLTDLPEVKVDGLDPWLALYEVNQGEYWLSIRGRNNYLDLSNTITFDQGKMVFTRFSSLENQSIVGLIDNGVYVELARLPSVCYKIYLDKHYNLWTYGEDGLFSVPFMSQQGDGPAHFFVGTHITSMMEDREGSYWISTHRKGIWQVPSFHSLNYTDLLLEGEKPITSISAVDTFLVGQAWNSGLGVLTPSGVKDHISGLKGYSAWTNSIFPNSAGDQACIFLNYPDQRDPHENLLASGVLKNRVYQFRNGDFFHLDFPFYAVKQQNGTVFRYTREILEDRVLCVTEDDQNAIWLGGLEGLYRIRDYQYSRLESLSEKFPLLKTRISEIRTSTSGVWISTVGNGLICLKDNRCFQFTTEEGLSSNIVQSLYLENDSVIWAGTIQGLNRLTFHSTSSGPQLKDLRTYGRNDGLPGERINDITWWKDRFWLATNEGVAAFQPELLPAGKTPPIVMIERVEVENDTLTMSAAAKLNPDQRDIVFHFLGVSHKKPINKPFYRYRLEKQGEESGGWKYTNNRSVQFTNLSHGFYTFRLQAQNKNGYWSTDPETFAFEVTPHYSETLVFKGGLLFAGLAVIKGLFLFRLRLTRKEFRYKLRLRDSELQLMRTQMSPHFIFNILNGIQQSIFDKKPEKASYYLSRFSRLMRKSLDFSRQAYISLQEEIAFLESYLELEKSRFEDQFDFGFSLDEKLEGLKNELYVPPLLIQPILENAIKHGIAGLDYKGNLDIKISMVENQLRYEVKDNGHGLQQEKSKSLDRQLHALDIVRDRLRMLNEEWPDRSAGMEMTNLSEKSETETGVLVVVWVPALTREVLELSKSKA